MRRMRKPLIALALCLTVSAFAAGAPPAGVEIVPAAGSYVITSDRVNVRDSPDLTAGKVVGSLNKGATVEVIEMTVLTFVVQGMRSAWYHLKSPDGWVYGYYLDPRDADTHAGPWPGEGEER
jgi:hypothetical protein